MKRVQPHQDAPLRPLLEADDDLWLDVCRQLHGVLAKRLKAQLPTPKAGIQVTPLTSRFFWGGGLVYFVPYTVNSVLHIFYIHINITNVSKIDKSY